jgi:hypothetical protein
MKRARRATIDELISTYAAHVSGSYASPAEFRKNLDRLILEKRARLADDAYIVALETNVVFLHDVIFEGEALLDVVFDAKRSRSLDSRGVCTLLMETERKVRGQCGRRRTEAFQTGADEEFSELRRLRAAGGAAYTEKLEFNYRYLMAYKILLFEFFNVAGTVVPRYDVVGESEENRRRVLGHIELTANYYLGNISVGEGAESVPPGAL